MPEVIEQINALLTPLLKDTDIFVTGIKIKPVNNVKVFLDADSGFSIEKCVTVNRKLYALIDASAMFPGGDFSLEVSSPGIDEPLQLWRQYKKNIGRKIAVTLNDGTEKTGMLLDVQQNYIILEVKLPRNKGTEEIEINFSDINKSIIQIIF